VNPSTNGPDPIAVDADTSGSDHEDRGGILIFVLVTVAICSLIVIPMLTYTSAVIRSETAARGLR
jgi:type II secretory pathway component PulK